MQYQRRLAAILFTHIVGYTAMMQKDEAKAVRTVKRYITALQKVIAEHTGEILNDYGDGSLYIFPSALDENTKLREKIKKMEANGEL
jgi:class 3 adenylate cyclase